MPENKRKIEKLRNTKQFGLIAPASKSYIFVITSLNIISSSHRSELNLSDIKFMSEKLRLGMPLIEQLKQKGNFQFPEELMRTNNINRS